MLEESYKLFLSSANLLPGWQDMNKNDLVNKYIEYEDKDSYTASIYMSAIICKYWPKIQRFYKTTAYAAEYEDIYDLLINSILRAIKARRWLQKDSTIYNDPTGPDKAINRTMICERLNFLAFKNRAKRVANLNPAYMDEIEEEVGDSYIYKNYSSQFSTDSIENEYETVTNFQFLYNKKLYLALFVYYSIIYNLGSFKDGKFSTKFCAKAILSIDDSDLEDLAYLLDVNKDEIKRCYDLAVSSKNRQELKLNIEYSMLKLKELYVKDRI